MARHKEMGCPLRLPARSRVNGASPTTRKLRASKPAHLPAEWIREISCVAPQLFRSAATNKLRVPARPLRSGVIG